MSVKNPTNPAASIRQRLLNYAKSTRQDFQRIIDGYAIECILDRLAHSAYADRFLLKGALLFTVWSGAGKRPTRDIDLMGRGENEISAVVDIFKEIISVEIQDDCMVFFPDRVEGMKIKEDDEYEGVRVFIEGSICGAISNVQVDIGFGDAVTPGPVYVEFPRMIKMRPFSLFMYPRETVFAEKLDAILTRGMVNSRMKDYYDLFILIRDNSFNAESLRRAVLNTLNRRKTILPDSCPKGLSEEFAHNHEKVVQWKSFLNKSGLDAGELSEIITNIRELVEKVFDW
ncbi:MAG: nucleotidyl transferase AbiEii/AbiGii toxin family protein [Chitinispirillaceae bacterium]|nr:nucleotidyl transferase AbiEii/AbiGii toxin family protein [Chitinispirillaceae bacterium]